MPESGVCLSTQQHGVNEHELQAGPATQRECLGVVKCREEPPLGQLGVGHLCGCISIVVMVSSQRIPPVLQGGCCEHVLQGTQQERRKGGSTWKHLEALGLPHASTSNVSLNLGSCMFLTP